MPPQKAAGGRSLSDMTGVELFCRDARGVPAVRIVRRKSALLLRAAGFVPPPAGGLPERWEDISRRTAWELPPSFRAPHAAIAVNSRLALFSQATADAVLHDMSAGIPSQAAVEPDEAPRRRFAVRRAEPAARGTSPEKIPDPGVPVAVNGMRFAVRPLAESGQHLEAALPEFQVLWLSRLLPEGHRPTVSSVQPAEAALMASVLAQPAITETGGDALVMFMLADKVIFGGYRAGLPVLWRHCPVQGGLLAMQAAVERAFGLDAGMAASFLDDSLIDMRGALEPLLGPVFNELALSRAYLSGKHGMKLDRMLLAGLPAGGRHVCSFARDSFGFELVQPGVFDGIQQAQKSGIPGDCAFLPALGAALAALEAES